MPTEAKPQLTSTEIGTIWTNYQITSASLVLFDLLKEKTMDKEAQNILSAYITECENIKNEIVNIFTNEKAVIPLGFEKSDIIK